MKRSYLITGIRKGIGKGPNRNSDSVKLVGFYPNLSNQEKSNA